MMGASGSGKSTFLRCINMLETLTSGKIYVRGELIRMKQNRKELLSRKTLNKLSVLGLGLEWFFSSSICGPT
ncbi:MAG: hypothetical protein CM1200mP30_16350 [Pseudomonadota bacterium]|nr:MAG: hypothetical protein CM1200mP30_16350 [Pseudomonadota bacterium]